MGKIFSRLTVFFDEPFWVGIYELQCDCKYEACKITFGAEPKDYEVYDFILKNWNRLKFSPNVKTDEVLKKRINPKRMQRAINKEIHNNGVGTKAQQALKLMHSQGKSESKTRSKEQRECQKEHQFKLRQAKRKQKHRGH